MEIIPIFIHHNGKWNKEMEYADFDVTRITIQLNCSFDEMLQIISEQLRIEIDFQQMVIQYKVRKNYPPLKIEDNATLFFYLQLKKKEHDFTKFPLCIIIHRMEFPQISFNNNQQLKQV